MVIPTVKVTSNTAMNSFIHFPDKTTKFSNIALEEYTIIQSIPVSSFLNYLFIFFFNICLYKRVLINKHFFPHFLFSALYEKWKT